MKNDSQFTKRTGSHGVSPEAQEIVNEFKRKHFDVLINKCTYAEFSAAQRSLYEYIVSLESKHD